MEESKTSTAGLEGGPPASPLTGTSSRKSFLRLAGGAGAAGALGILVAACGGGQEEGATTTEDQPQGGNDLDIVNYALVLEYLEAKFYADVLAAGVVKDAALADIVKLIGQNENEHVELLTAMMEQLGGVPAVDPKGNFDEVIQQGEEEVLRTAASIENLGAAAYLGQVTRVQAPSILSALLSIHSVEARHAAVLNQAAGFDFETGDDLEGSIPDGAFATPMEMQQVLDAVQPYLPKQG
jgi:rubrerythrin